MKNREDRNFPEILKKICKLQDIGVKHCPYELIFKLSKNDMSKHILGYRFEINEKDVNAICDNKYQASKILMDNHISVVEYICFPTLSSLEHLMNSEYREEILNYLNKHRKLVCKPNKGTLGQHVFKVKNEKELKDAIKEISLNNKEFVLCPYYSIKHEYRVILLNDVIKLVYRKEIPFVIGNGRDTIKKLMKESKSTYNIEYIDKDIKMDSIPDDKEVVKLNWKHNLTSGSSVQIIKDQDIVEKLSTIARDTSKVLNIRFASFDIIETNNDYKILEINSGVMMESFSKMSKENYDIAESIYKDAVEFMFNINE